MAFDEIRKKIMSLEKYFLAKTDAGPRPDIPARAVVEKGLRCRVHSPDGKRRGFGEHQTTLNCAAEP